MTVTDTLSLDSGDLELSKLLFDKVQAAYQLLSLSDFSWLHCICCFCAQPGGDLSSLLLSMHLWAGSEDLSSTLTLVSSATSF